jgi:hypothetical protein
MNRIQKSLDTLQKRIVKHWQTTFKGIVYGVITYMYFVGKINTTEWITAIGSILTFNSIFLQKDPGKVANKPEPLNDRIE